MLSLWSLCPYLNTTQCPFSPSRAPLICVKDVFYKKQSSLPLISTYYDSVTSNAFSLASALSATGEKNPSSTLVPVKKAGSSPHSRPLAHGVRWLVEVSPVNRAKPTPSPVGKTVSWGSILLGPALQKEFCFPAYTYCRRDRDKLTDSTTHWKRCTGSHATQSCSMKPLVSLPVLPFILPVKTWRDL